jgi:hypothetical protein
LNGGYEAIEIAGVSTSQSQLNGDFQNNTIVGNAIGIVRGGRIAHLEIRNTILWDNGDDLVNAVSAEVHCSDIGDGDFNGVNGNISLDPLFCDPLAGDYHLDDGSPCRPFSPENPDCDLVGAWPVGCEPSGMEDPAGEAHASALRLLTCAPSPTRGITLLRFSIPTAANVRLAIYGVDAFRRERMGCHGTAAMKPGGC